MKEIWKDISGYKGMYQVSNFGNVKSLERIVKNGTSSTRLIRLRILKGRISDGYKIVWLGNMKGIKPYRIHTLVVMGFLNHKPSRKLVVDHIDNDKLNNNLSNLQIITQRENCSKDKFRGNYTSQYIGVSWVKRNKKWRAGIGIKNQKKDLGLFENELDAANAYKTELLKLNQT